MKPDLLLRIFREKKTLGITVAALLAANVALYSYVTAWARPDLDVLFRTWNEKRATLSPGAAGDVAATHRQGVADLAQFRQRIPVKRDFTRVVGEIFQVATDHHVSVTGVQYKPEKTPKGALTYYEVSLSTSGSYRNIKSFLADLAGMKDMVTVDSLAISRGENDLVALQTQLTVFLQMEKQ